MIELKVGHEVLARQVNFVTNCGKGTNLRTNKHGYYLLTKVRLLEKIAKYLSFCKIVDEVVVKTKFTDDDYQI